MSRNVMASPYDRTQVPELERCKFTSTHGRRCKNPHNSNANNFCIVHQRHAEKLEDAQAQSISDQLFSGAPELRTREELGRVMAQLFTLIAQRKIRQREGALLAYVASLLLQTMLPTTAPADLPARVVWDIPMGEPTREELQHRERQQNSNPQFPNRT
jgi:hypothetical protein